MRPRSDGTQRCEHFDVSVTPKPDRLTTFEDLFGNEVTELLVAAPLQRLCIQVDARSPRQSRGAALVRICGMSISGAVSATNGSGPVVIGEGNAECPSTKIHGSVTVKGNTAGVLIDINNTVARNLTVKGNGPTVLDKPNRVEGRSKIQ